MVFSVRSKSHWPRAILLIDMDAFFAAIEQRERPELRNCPVVITNGEKGSCIITSSYEARQYGIRTGMRLYEARTLCPHLTRVAARPDYYARISQQVMEALYHHVTPDIEVYSVDEAFLDVTRCQQLHGDPETIAYLAKSVIWNAVQLPCSIGVSGDRTTAKYAAKKGKPEGLVVIPPWQAKAALEDVPVQELCGIAKGTAQFLAQYGAYTCGDVAKLPIGVLAKRFGNIGRRIWLMCQGADLEPIRVNVEPPKTMGHGKVMPPETRDRFVVLAYLLHMAVKLAHRLRRHHYYAQYFMIGFRTDQDWLGAKTKSTLPTQDAQTIYKLGKQVLDHVWRGEGLYQIQVTALTLYSKLQLPLGDLDLCDDKQRLHRLLDNVQRRFGSNALVPARLLKRSSTPSALPPRVTWF